MEQHRTRPPQRRQPPQAAPAPPAPGGSAVYRVRVRSVPPVVLALRRFPNPRLTGIGAGLFASLTMLVLACVDRLLFDSSELVYGLLFLPVSALTALWVRPADLVTAPISVPIAFAVGVFPISGGSDGFGGQVMGLVTALAVHAGWLYGGTLVAGVIATVRKVRLMRARRRYVLAQGRGTAGERPPRAAVSASAAKPVRAGAGTAAAVRRPQRP
ncbi:membrane protein [Streptomyces sp. Tue 6075]|nr:membrane protein [Streptomyces sp. Tue 6075]